ncbi:MAG: phasin family protein [Burkholderiaceae bacterium]|jgi:poly(hydroxyalkanoate) granule-associated protein|nr:phasin family protein [Burkholderiaceae bacterium]
MTPKQKDSGSAAAAPPAPQQPDAMQDNVWLAGLGAWAQAQARGTEAFDALVQTGLEQQARARELAESELTRAAQHFATLTASASAMPWDRLSGIFETRVARAMEHLGVPTPQTLLALTRRIDQLERRIAQLEKAPAAAASGARPAVQAKARPKPPTPGAVRKKPVNRGAARKR